MRNFWYVAEESKKLKSAPVSLTILNERIVLFRNENGEPAALQDRCPHRNVPLSQGKVCKGHIACPYHGWEFNSNGECTHIPVLTQEDPIPNKAKCKSYPTIDSQGYIWIWIGEELPENAKPFKIPYYNEKGWTKARLWGDIENSVENCIENFIDNPHTSYVHGGLFRTPDGHLSHTVVRRKPDQIVIDINEEVSKNSLFAKVFIRDGEGIYHQDRFLLPSTVQVAYGFGKKYQITGFLFCTPINEFKTRVFAHITWKLGFWLKWIKPLVPIFGKIILNQDRKILEAQKSVILHDGEHFASTAADTANLWIRSLRKQSQKTNEDKSISAPLEQKQLERNVTLRL